MGEFIVPEPLLVMVYIIVTFAWFWMTETQQRAVHYLGRLQRKMFSKPLLS